MLLLVFSLVLIGLFCIAYIFMHGNKQRRNSERADKSSEIAQEDTPDPQPAASRPTTLKREHRTKVVTNTLVPGTVEPSTVQIGQPDYSIGKPSASKRSIRTDVSFVNAGDSALIHGADVGDLLFTGSKPLGRGYQEPAVIYAKLPIQHALSEPLSYWPNYKELTPAQRGRYITWLEEGRQHTDEIGYVFLFFYGLERYVLRDSINDSQEVRHKNLCAIIGELVRLRGMYAENKSFDSYSDQLIDVIYILHLQHRLDDRKINYPVSRSVIGRYAVAKQANTLPDIPLDADWALNWILTCGPIKRLKTVKDNYQLLRVVFRSFYESEGGIKVPQCKTKLDISITPASHGLDYESRLATPVTWCDPSGLQKPMKKLTPIYEKSIQALRPIARAMKKDDKLALLSAWPEELPVSAVSSMQRIATSIDTFLEEHSTPRVSALGRLLGADLTDKATPTQLKQISSALSKCGHVLVPEPIITPVSVKPMDTVHTYRGSRLTEISPEGLRIALTIQLGCLLAMADDDIHEREQATLERIVQSHSNSEERTYLLAYLGWRLGHPPSTAGLKKMIDSLCDEQKEEIGQQLIQLALADGELPSSEIKQLEKLFNKLGLDVALVSHYLHASASASEIRSVSKNSSPGNAPGQSDHTGLRLDSAALAAHRESTAEIQDVLHRIFEEEPEVPNEEAFIDDAPSDHGEAWHDGQLDEPHHSLAAWLMTGEEWSMAEINQRCSELGLLPDGALERINNVAFDVLGDALLELGDPVEVYLDILPA